MNKGPGEGGGNTAMVGVRHYVWCTLYMGERNPTSTKGRSRWKSSSENYLLIAEVRVRVRD